MAKKPTAPAINLVALAAIVAAGENGTFGPLAEVKPLADAGLIEINEGVTDANGNVAVRATAAGIAKNAENSEAAPAAPKSNFAVVTVPDDIFSAAKEKRRASRGVAEKYPFDSLEVKGGFFVPATEKMPEPAKSLASTVSSATARYAVEAKDENGAVIMETVTVKDYATDADGKRMKDADGHWIVTAEREEERAKMEPTRQFKLVPAEGGAWVVRTA